MHPRLKSQQFIGGNGELDTNMTKQEVFARLKKLQLLEKLADNTVSDTKQDAEEEMRKMENTDPEDLTNPEPTV